MTDESVGSLTVMQVVPFNTLGGPTLRTLNLCEHLDDGFDHVVVTPTGSAEFGAAVRDAGVPLRSIPLQVPAHFGDPSVIGRNLRWVVDFLISVARFRRVVEER